MEGKLDQREEREEERDWETGMRKRKREEMHVTEGAMDERERI